MKQFEQFNEKQASRISALSHAIQTGITMTMEVDPENDATSPKHLRVGVNISLIDHGSIVRLLVKKGLFTLEEYGDSIIEGMENEVKGYEARLGQVMNTTITLG